VRWLAKTDAVATFMLHDIHEVHTHFEVIPLSPFFSAERAAKRQGDDERVGGDSEDGDRMAQRHRRTQVSDERGEDGP